VVRNIFSLLAAISMSIATVAPAYALPTPALTAKQAKAQADYLKRLAFYEQRLNDRVENLNQFVTIRDANIDFQYRPEARSPFKLWTVLVPENEMTVINTSDYDLDERFVVIKNGTRYIKMAVHPVSRKAFLEHLPEDKYEWSQDFEAMALASYRSLVAWDAANPGDPFQIKVSLDAIIGANLRMLSHRQIERAAASSYILKSLDRRFYASQGILFMDEPVGAYLNKFKFGFALRETPILDPGTEYIPMFSLYARPGGQPSLISKMLRASGMSARDYVQQNIIFPMIKHMVMLAFEDGIVMEAHEQNSLAEVKNGKLTGRFVYRDLGGFFVNPDMRAAKGKDMSFLPREFDRNNLRVERATLIEHVIGYLGDSNFYALRKSLVKEFPTLTPSFINESIRLALASEIYLRTGTNAQSATSMSTAITKHINEMKQNVISRNAVFSPVEDLPNCLYLLSPEMTKDFL
jgi:hypothetical protein